MANDMLTPEAMSHLPGAPFTDAEVDAAVGALRTALGWHVAPLVPESVLLDVVCADDTLRLPTRELVSVTTVTDVEKAATIDPARYRVSHARARIRKKGGYWPHGFEAVQVDMQHGFAELPPELLPIVGQLALKDRRDRGVRIVSVDDASTTYAGALASAAEGLLGPDLLARYRFPAWPGMA